MRLTVLLLGLAVVHSTQIVLYLAQVASDSAELKQSLRALSDVFIAENPHYPVVVAYEEEDAVHLTEGLKKGLRLALGATEIELDRPYTHITGPKICFVSIRGFRRVPWPFAMYADDYSEANPYYSRRGYRYMCRFWANSVFTQPFMRNVTAYLRLDTDSKLVQMKENPFALLESERLAYLTSVVYKDAARQTEGLWETFLRFARRENIHPKGLAPLSNLHVDTHSAEEIAHLPIGEAVAVLWQSGYNLDYVYNNWEATRVDIWQSPVYRRLAKFIDRSGGIIMRRWGDAPIRTLALHLLREEFSRIANVSSLVFRQYKGLKVFHTALHQT
jgi:hypothetical protein